MLHCFIDYLLVSSFRGFTFSWHYLFVIFHFLQFYANMSYFSVCLIKFNNNNSNKFLMIVSILSFLKFFLDINFATFMNIFFLHLCIGKSYLFDWVSLFLTKIVDSNIISKEQIIKEQLKMNFFQCFFDFDILFSLSSCQWFVDEDYSTWPPYSICCRTRADDGASTFSLHSYTPRNLPQYLIDIALHFHFPALVALWVI